MKAALKGWLTALAVFIVATGPVRGAVITINETIDIGGYSSGATIFHPIATQTIAVGDFVDLTVDFAAGQILHIGDGSERLYGWLNGAGASSSFGIQNVQLDFLGPQSTGGASSSIFIASQSSGNAHIGAAFVDFLSAGQAIAFTGYRVRYDVTSLSEDPNTYSNIWFFVRGNDVYVSTVPEPATLLLLGLGVAGLGFARKSLR